MINLVASKDCNVLVMLSLSYLFLLNPRRLKRSRTLISTIWTRTKHAQFMDVKKQNLA